MARERVEQVAVTAKTAARHERLLEERRKIGAFYTPEPLSRILSDWAIRSAIDTVLEPSFGGCGFLECARQRLQNLGCREPVKQIFGCDIDPVAFEYLAGIFNGPVDLERFVQADFLDVQPGSPWPDTFSTVIANPPYIPYQELGTERRKQLDKTEWRVEGVGGRSSLWAYFIAHSVAFLAEGGRMAWVLPGAFLQADYAKPIRNFLATEFGRVLAIVLRERIFLEAGADEETVILVADGFRSMPASGRIELGQVDTLESLKDLLERWDGGCWQGVTGDGRPAGLSLSDSEHRLFARIAAADSCRALGDMASVQIGLVTGANDFFVLSEAGIAKAGLTDADCTPILAKFVAAPGVTFSMTDHLAFLKSGGNGHLIDSAGPGSNPRIDDYLATFPEDVRENTSTFKKRKLWSKPDDGRVPDAFFPVMHHWGPRLVLNPDGFTNTNTIHRVYFRDTPTTCDQRLIAISLLTSFSQLSAELVGRRYGSGVLKHEPREAEKIQLMIPLADTKAIKKTFKAIDRDLRANDRVAAMRRADALIYAAAGIAEWADASERLSSALEHVRERRRPNRSPRRTAM